VAEYISITDLFNKLKSERNTGELLPMPADFYAIAEKYINDLASAGNATEAENARKLLGMIKEKRKQKLLIYLAYGRPLPKPIPEEEESLYNEVAKLISNNSSHTVKIKIKTDLPKIVTPSGKELGPFKTGEVVEISEEDAEFVLMNSIGEKV